MPDIKQNGRIYSPESYTAENAAVPCPEMPEELAGIKQNISHMTVTAGTENVPAGQKGSIKSTSKIWLSVIWKMSSSHRKMSCSFPSASLTCKHNVKWK